MSETLSVEAKLQLGAFALDVAFDAPAKGVTALFGPSGAGKSLLLSTIAGLRRVQSGCIALGARVLDDAAAGVHTPPHLRGIGLVFQDARLFPHLPVRGNLAYAEQRAPLEKRKLSLEAAAAHFDITDLLDRPVRNLSGGEKSRVALARALLSAPDFLLLDEPFAALDGPRRRAFLATLRKMHVAFDLPMLVVTHQIDDAAALADHLVGLQAGQVAAQGALAETALTHPFRALLAPGDVGAALPVASLASARANATGHVWVRADHVLLANAKPHGLSARNIWEGRLTALDQESEGAILAQVQTANASVVARITPAAAADLNLAAGQTVWAVVKAHSI